MVPPRPPSVQRWTAREACGSPDIMIIRLAKAEHTWPTTTPDRMSRVTVIRRPVRASRYTATSVPSAPRNAAAGME